MAPQLLFIDQATGRVQAGNADTAAPLLLALQGTTLALRVGFVTEAIPGELPEGTTGRLIAKKELDHTGDPVLFDGAWMLDDEGTNARYEFSTLVDGVGLRALLNGKPHVQLGVQIEWQVPGEDAPRKSQPFALHVLNSYAQEEDGVPNPATAAAWEWIKARLVAGTNITLTINEDGKTITIAATGEVGGAVTWGAVTGKPSTFPPAGHSHVVGDLPIASQGDAEAGVSSSKVMTPLRVAQAIAALGGTGGGTTTEWPARVWVREDGDDSTAVLGRIDKPFASLGAAWEAWLNHDSHNPIKALEIILHVGTFTWLVSGADIRARIIGAGLTQSNCIIEQQGAEGADGIYGDPDGGNGNPVFLHVESDGSVYFPAITLLGGDGGDAYYDPDHSSAPGNGGGAVANLKGLCGNSVSLKSGARGGAGSGSEPPPSDTLMAVNMERCDFEDGLYLEISPGQKFSEAPDNIQIRFSRLAGISLAGAGSEAELGFAYLSELRYGPEEPLIIYKHCVGINEE